MLVTLNFLKTGFKFLKEKKVKLRCLWGDTSWCHGVLEWHNIQRYVRELPMAPIWSSSSNHVITQNIYEKNERVGQLEQEEKSCTEVLFRAMKFAMFLWFLSFLLPNYPIDSLGLLFKNSIYVNSTKNVQMFLVCYQQLLNLGSKQNSFAQSVLPFSEINNK